MTISGKATNADKTFPVINPATAEAFAECPDASQQQVEQAVQAAHTALPSWRRDETFRRKCLTQCAKAVLDHKQELAELLTKEQGKPLARAMDEVEAAAHRIQVAANAEIPVVVLQDDKEARVEVHYRPIGVVALITPWNFPLAIAAKFAMPLVLGNTVVIKPSPYTPLTTLRMGELIRDILPPGVLNVVSGDDHVGALLTQHPLVRKIGFTGSVPTGKKIAMVAAEDLKRVTLELGGNDPAIVLSDVDVNKVASKLFWGAFGNSGQICTAIKRMYIHEDVFEPLVHELINLANNTKVGDGFDPDTRLGPLNNKPQLDIVSGLVDDAKKQGAEILTGGEGLNSPGYFYRPTLLDNVKEGIRIVDEEQFGPALPLIRYRDVDDVIARANNTMMGLGASVWTSDIEHGAEIAGQLESGVAWVNRTFTTHTDAPFGGFKHSGIGREWGPWGVAAYSEIQTVSIEKK